MKTSIYAGVLGAVGSSVGKLAFDGSSSAVALATSWCATKVLDQTLTDTTCESFVYLFRALLAIGMILINGAMLGIYVRAMQEEGSLAATVTNFGASFVTTGVIGHFVFHEPLNMHWCFGASLISIGVYLVALAAPSALPSADNDGDQKKEQ